MVHTNSIKYEYGKIFIILDIQSICLLLNILHLHTLMDINIISMLNKIKFYIIMEYIKNPN